MPSVNAYQHLVTPAMMKEAVRLSVAILLLTAGCDASPGDEYDLVGQWHTDACGVSTTIILNTNTRSFRGDAHIVDGWGQAFTADLFGTRQGTVIAFTISRLEGVDVQRLGSFDGSIVGENLIAGDFAYDGRTSFATLHRVHP